MTVVLWTLPDENGDQQELVGRGRYLDRWDCRDGVWAIEHRIHLLDLSSVSPLARADISACSSRNTEDLSFEFIPKA